MARVASEQDLLLRKRARRRLVGSIVLVIMAIVILPMVLDRVPKQEGKKIEVIIPSENLPGEFSPNVALEASVPTIVDSASKGAIPKAQQTTETKSNLPVKPTQIKKKQAGKIVGSKGGSEYNHEAERSATTPEVFVVQLGAFSDSAKAKDQQSRLASNGINKSYTETIKNDNTEVTRVRIGPFSTREAAEEGRKKLKRLGLDGVVMSK